MKQRTKCFIYTRVSTSMQVDGYSLDGQKDRLRKYADYQDYQIVGEYSDEGKSGKNVEGRPEFLKMLRDIESGEYGVSFVLVFKLSRFGRNAADVLTSLQRMQDYGVNLICVEDSIDSSKDAGKLMISVLSAVAEIERENILVQTMEGRRQKAREGKWNGGFAPYGYKLENGELLIEPDEAEVVKIIFDKYTTTPMGTQKIAYWLNEHGYRKIQRHNNKLEAFTGAFVVGVIDNPVYFGKIAYGRRHNEKIPGTRNEYHVVRTDDYMLVDGKHEPIIPEETWRAAHVQRESTNKKQPKTHSLDHEHILSSILRCPVCGCGMYGNVNRKKKGDGTYYKDYFYYACKHRLHVDGKRCDYHHQWGEDIIDSAVEEVIKKLVSNPQNEQALRDKIGSRIDTAELEKELEVQQKLLRQQTGTKDRLSEQIDNLDFDDPHYDRKFQDLQERQNRIYDLIAETEVKLANVQDRLENVRQQKVSADHVYQFLLYFDQLYDKFTDAEKKAFMSRFIESVEIYPERQPNGQILKHIEFAFPVYYKGNEMTGMSWDSEGTVETVAFLSKLRTTQHIDVDLDLTELDVTAAEAKATYAEIQAYVLEHTGLRVSCLYIAQVKAKYGIIERECYNKAKTEGNRVPKCHPEKEQAIEEALRHFQMI